MSDNYHYEDGAIHNDHKKVLHIDNVSNGDIGKLIRGFIKDDIEDAKVVEEARDVVGQECEEELCFFIHPSVDSSQEWQVHDEIKRLVKRHGIKEICSYLLQMRKDNKLLLPQSPSVAYAELVRMGMPSGEGFNETTFRKYYKN